MARNHLQRISLLSLFAGSLTGYAANFADLVYVDTGAMADSQKTPSLQPFYIDIFETSGSQAAALDSTITYNKDKPARMTLDQAKNVCAKRGMRLPTQEEWLAAASNLGVNHRFTLRGDTINGADYTRVNIGTGDSIVPNELTVGIDAIGTMGMTGNRAEYFLNADGTSGECGGKYETRSEADVELARICSHPTDNAATARCVISASAAPNVSLSNRVPNELKTYLTQKGNASAPSSANSNTTPTPPTNPPAAPVDPAYDEEF